MSRGRFRNSQTDLWTQKKMNEPRVKRSVHRCLTQRDNSTVGKNRRQPRAAPRQATRVFSPKRVQSQRCSGIKGQKIPDSETLPSVHESACVRVRGRACARGPPSQVRSPEVGGNKRQPTQTTREHHDPAGTIENAKRHQSTFKAHQHSNHKHFSQFDIKPVTSQRRESHPQDATEKPN